MHSSPSRLLSLVVLLLPMTGCGSSNELERHDISGEVKFENEPLEQGTIRFVPTGAKGVSVGAEIKGGHYATVSGKGLPNGTYRVEISSTDESEKADEPLPGDSRVLSVDRIPEKYNVQSKTEITVDGSQRTFDFDLE